MKRRRSLAQIEDTYGTIWRFDTARYTVACWAEEEDMDPRDSMQFDEDIEFALEGDSHWFCACVGVFKCDDNSADDWCDDDFECIGYDVLGGCSYRSYREFVSGHRQGGPADRNCLATKARNVVICHYFPDMVRQAVAEARA